MSFNDENSLKIEKTTKTSEKPTSELLGEWMRISKTHGLDRLVTSRNLTLRIIWILSLLVSSATCSFLIARIITDYLKYEVKTRIRETYVEKVPFPMISVCNINPMITPEANDYIRNYFQTNFNVSITKFTDFANYSQINVYSELEYLSYSLNDPGFNKTLRKSFGYDFFLTCIYYDPMCEINDILDQFDPIYGNCLLINSNKFKNGSEREPFQAYLPNNGLSLFVYTGPSENETNFMFDRQIKGKGLTVRIKEPDYTGLFWVEKI